MMINGDKETERDHVGSRTKTKRSYDGESSPGQPPTKAFVNPTGGYSSFSQEFTCKYTSKDLPQYVVLIQKDSANDSSRINPVMVSRVISKLVGNNNILEVKSAGRNKVSVSFNNFERANSLSNMEALKVHNLKAIIPAFRVMRTGVIKNVPLDISEETIQNEFSSTAKIVSVRRLCRKERKDGKEELIPTFSVMAKFQGQVLPRSLTYLHVSFPVIPYIPRVLMCFACLRFGHISSDCKSAARCSKCGQNRHEKIEDCHQPP